MEEFAKVMSQSPGKPPSDEEVKKIIQEVDLDGDGTINFNGMSPHPPLFSSRKVPLKTLARRLNT